MSQTIGYEETVSFSNKASLFDVCRLSAAIRNELDSPQRMLAARQAFKAAGCVKRRHQKTVSCTTAGGSRWREAYSLLYAVVKELGG